MKIKELKESSTDVQNTHNSNYGDMKKNVKTYERKAMEKTPFVIHHSETEGWSAGIAEHRLTGWYETEEDLKKVLRGITSKQGASINWDLLTGVVLILIEKVAEAKKLTDKINENQG